MEGILANRARYLKVLRRYEHTIWYIIIYNSVLITESTIILTSTMTSRSCRFCRFQSQHSPTPDDKNIYYYCCHFLTVLRARGQLCVHLKHVFWFLLALNRRHWLPPWSGEFDSVVILSLDGRGSISNDLVYNSSSFIRNDVSSR